VTLGEVGKYLKREMTYQARRRFGRVQEASLNGRGSDVLAPKIVQREQLAIVATAPKPKPPSPAKPAVGIYPKPYKPGDTFKDCDTCPEMVVVPAGSFRMGDLSGVGDDDEKPVHRVTIPEAFAVGKFEVTQAQWKEVKGTNPSRVKGNNKPVNRVSWLDAQQYILTLNKRLGLSYRRDRYRLLSESEWEYVARAGTTTKYHFGDTISKSQANYSGSNIVDVGKYPANAFGLYDVHGNVYEWVEDCWNRNYINVPADGSSWVPDNCGLGVLRSGSGDFGSWAVRSAGRHRGGKDWHFTNFGFRIARTLLR
jgi:formylglycine-generating enzyme required for sulfatase activity